MDDLPQDDDALLREWEHSREGDGIARSDYDPAWDDAPPATAGRLSWWC